MCLFYTGEIFISCPIRSFLSHMISLNNSRYKLSLLTHWVPGASAIFLNFFIQAKLGKAPVCSAWITQVNINSINYPLTPLINH